MIRACAMAATILLEGVAVQAQIAPGLPPPASPGLAAVVDAARADAAQRSGLPASQLQVVLAESVTWSDGSLGCPRPGMLYTQALVPGFRVRLKVAADVWNYHASGRGAPALCPPEWVREPGPGSRS